MRITAITFVTNEAPFLIEWIAFCRVIGVTDFLCHSGDCTDATAPMLDRLQELGGLRHLPNTGPAAADRAEALKQARNQSSVADADWVWIAGVDEFLNIRAGAGTIPDLIAACGAPHAISVSSQVFANGGIEGYEDRPVIAQFAYSHNPDIRGTRMQQDVRTLVRKDFPLGHYGAHRPFMQMGLTRANRPVWTDGSGRDVAWKFRAAATVDWADAYPAKGARRFATLNRYGLRSLDSYMLRQAPGGQPPARPDDGDWRDQNDPAFEDRSIQRLLPRVCAMRTSSPRSVRMCSTPRKSCFPASFPTATAYRPRQKSTCRASSAAWPT